MLAAAPTQLSYFFLSKLTDLSAAAESFFLWDRTGRPFPLLIAGIFWSVFFIFDIVFYSLSRLRPHRPQRINKPAEKTEPNAGLTGSRLN